MTLLEHAARNGSLGNRAPLADRMRPRNLDEVLGQTHLLGEDRWLRRAILGDRFPSLILWGPPGTGKTTLASVIARATARTFVPFSAVLGGVPELRTLLAEADENLRYRGRGTVLFVDEIHRFNKAQQDAFLPHVERGTVTLIGATTENPSFSVNRAVLSRAKVLSLESLKTAELVRLLERALSDHERGLGALGVEAEPTALAALAEAASGDARRALGLLEAAVESLSTNEARASTAPKEGATPPLPRRLTLDVLGDLLGDRPLLYDKDGDQHHQLTSALIKSMRGSDPDAAVYYLMRMLEAGDDPTFVLRRLIIFASEDVGNAEPRALPLAIAADEAFRRMGMPEGIYPIAHATLFLASCPKSGAVGKAFSRARELVQSKGALPVPRELKNAHTALQKQAGDGAGYRYPHDYREGFVPGATYLPSEIAGERLYEPTEQGLEKAIGERLARIRAAREK